MPTPSSDLHDALAANGTRLVQQPARDPRPDGTDPGAGATGAAGSAGGAGGSDTMRFRAPTLEAAIALAETSLGSRVRVVAANRIRRGGIGGFFASDLGVEVTVALDDETMEDALARLVAESEADDRAQWTSMARPTAVADARQPSPGVPDAHALLESFAAIAARTSAIEPAPHPADRADRTDVSVAAAASYDDDRAPHTVNPVLAEVLAAIMEEAAQAQRLETRHEHSMVDDGEYTPEPETPIVARRLVAPAATTAAAVPVPTRPVTTSLDTGRRPVYATPPTMVRVEQIIEELSAITAAPVFSAERAQPRVPRARFGDRQQPSEAGVVRPGDLAESTGPTETGRPALLVDRPKVLPTLPPRASEIARAASAASAASHARLLHSPEPRAVVEEVAQTSGVDVSPVEQVASVELDAGAGCADGTSTRRLQVPARHTTTVVPATAATGTNTGTGSTHAPSRRHVELAVAATDQLIESLTRDEGVKRLSVRVVLRTADHREVETEAEWEAE